MRIRHCAVKSCHKPNDGTLSASNRVCKECLSIQIPCICGCNQLKPKYDKQGKEHKCIDGHFIEETRKKISESHKGEKNPMYGKPRTEESNRKNSESQKGKKSFWHGKHQTEEHKRKNSESHKGEKNYNYGKHRTEESKRKQSESYKGEKNPFYGKHHKEETKEKNRQGVIQARKDGKYSIFPNKPETLIYNHLQGIKPKEWRYTGDGSFWVGNMNPDLTNIEAKKCVEVNGCYWHDCPICYPNGTGNRYRLNEKDIVAKYKEYGWDCLVIWEHDIKNGKYKQLINDFLEKKWIMKRFQF